MKNQLVTILESDEGAKTCHVQINNRGDIGNPEKSGGNARHEFSTAKNASEPWKGDVRRSLEGLYPGAEIHTRETLNTEVIGPALIAKGTHVTREGSAMPIPKEEAARLDKIEADRVAEEKRLADEKAATEKLEAERAEALRIAKEKGDKAGDVGDAAAVNG